MDRHRAQRLRRRALVLCLLALPWSPAAARPVGPPPASAADTSLARWDSLYARHDYFTLRDSVSRWSGQETPGVRYFRGLVARAFNQPDEAIALLKPLVDSASRFLTSARLLPATRSLADSYVEVYRYREAAAVYALALRARPFRGDSASRLDLQSAYDLCRALGDVLPQAVTWSRAASLDSIPNGGFRARIIARINVADVAEPLQVSVRSRFTLLDSTTAAQHGVHIVPGSVRVESLAGGFARARIGVISKLQLGAASVSNVVALVLADSDLTTSSGRHVTGVIGFPVLAAIGRVALMSDGHVALSSPGAARSDTTRGAPFSLDPASRNGLTPVVDARVGGKRASFTVSFAAVPSALYASALPLLSDATPPGTRATSTDALESSDGIRDLEVLAGGRTLSLESVRILSDTLDPEYGLHAGILGADALAEADALTFDFSAMTVAFERLPPPPVLPDLALPGRVTTATAPENKPRELIFIGLLFALFILPKALQRFRIPGAITSLLMGVAATGFGAYANDPTLELLSTFGIVALFLFAGLEIDAQELRKNASALLNHALIWVALASLTALVAAVAFGATPRVAALLSLALVTPSTGFILSSLGGFGLGAAEQRTVKIYAIGSELIALAVLFFVLQSTSLQRLVLAIAVMIAVVVLIPIAFRVFASVVAPYAPRSEFAFLLMVAVVCAYTTRRLGVYYLVGAFLVGVAAQRFRADHPAMSSEKMVDALESFGSVFIPFYFFHAGTQIARGQLTLSALFTGLALAAGFVPLRIAVIGLHRRLAVGERFRSSRRIGAALVPTLVFTLVLVGILHDNFKLSDAVTGGLVLYTILNTMAPAIILRGVPADFEDVAAAPVGEPLADRG